MKRENNKKFKKRKRNQNRSLTCRVLSMMFAIVLFCSTVLINTDYVSQASSFDDMVGMVEVEEDSAAVDTSEETTDDLDTDVNFESEESTDETYSESDDLGSSDADFSSGENMFTDGTSENSAPTEEAAQPVSCIVNLKNETIEIKAEAPAGVLPNGTQMIVKAVENNTEDAELTDQYNKLAAKITEQLQSQGKNLDGFLAYNVSFTDADGNPVEPSDKVTYSFTYKEASSPELTDPAASTVTAAMIRTNKETSELELTELKAEEDQLTVETNESRQLTKAAFQSAATAAFTFVWSSTPAADDNENNENKEENGEVTSVVDMTKENSAVVETNEAGEVQKAEFETESFSTFTITWKYTQNGNTYNKNLTVHLVYLDNGQYKKIPDAVNEYEENINDGENIELADLANEYKVEGYAYEQALESNKTKEISSISYNSNSHGKSGWFYKNDDGWTHATTNADYNIYLVYNKLSVWIKDDIMYTGNLILETDEATTNKINNAITAGKEVTYTWSKSTDGGKNYTPVERKRRGNNYNLSEDGKSLNVALDDGALNSEQTSVKYKVNIIIKEDDNNVENIESEVFDNEYWNELQNGSFETPTIDSTSSINEQYTNAAYKKAGGVWQSTGRPENNNVNIEIVNTRASFQSSYGWHGTDKAYDGNQFAELNCEAPGALYQDVMTYAGETMNYWLSHRARGAYPNGGYIPGEKDTMYLVIMPTSTAMTATSGSELKTQGQLEEYLRSRLPGVNLDAEASGDGNQKSEILYNNDGILISRITSDDQSWQRILKTDLYRSTSYLTRFFFMSGHTASGKDTVGNFLDKVGFSQQLPPVTEDEFTLQIKKSFEGLGSADIEKVKENISFKIKASKDGTDLTDDEITELFGCNTISGSDMAQQLDGSLQYTIANRKIGINDTYQVMITEEDAGLSGYTLNTSSTTSILTKDTAEPDVKEGSEFELKGKKTATVTFTNNYEADNQKKIHFTKIWDDNNNAYGTRPDSLAVTLHATYDANGKSNDLDLTDLVKPGVTITLNAASEWKCSWTVPVYYALDNGTKAKIDYTVTEGENTSDYVYKAVTEDGKAISGDGSDYNKQFNGSEITTPGNTTSAQSAPRKSRMRVASNNNELTTVADTNGTTTSDLGEPAHTKYITYNSARGDYTLHLDVTGAKGSAKGVDVLFVIDTSGSMGSGNNNLLPKVKTLLTKDAGLVDKIFSKIGNVNNVAMVSFSDMQHTNPTSWYGTSSKGDFKKAVNKLSASGGTKWTYAMVKARELLDDRSNSSNEKVVIFLSDGEPTYSCEKKTNWFGQSTWEQTGYGTYTKDEYYTEAAAQVTGSLASAKMYSVYLTSDTKDGMETFSKKLTNSELVNGTRLDSALTGILNKVIPTYKNVTITDTLSEYVDFVETTPTITVTKKNAAGTTTLTADTDYTKNCSGKTVTVRLLNGNSLEDGVTYTVSFRVKPSDFANTYYKEHQSYPDTAGDAGTGTTSAGKAGFYSNDSAQTNISYEIDGTSDGLKTASYIRPVVQVTTHTLTYKKEWNYPSGINEPTQDVKLNVSYSDGTTKEITLTKDEQYTYQESVPVTKYIVDVTETPVADYEASYSITDNGTKAVVTNNYNKVTASNITVTKVWNGHGPQPAITVGLYRSVDGAAADKCGEVTLSSGNDWSHTWNNLPKSEGSATGVKNYSYAVREESIPSNYQSSISYDYGNDTITATITNTYDPNCADENYYIANVLQTEKLHIIKTWDDNSNEAGKRPTDLSVNVNGMNFTLSGDGNRWTQDATILKKKNPTYNATEKLTSSDYKMISSTVTSVDDGKNIEFVNQLQTKEITVHKVWKDGNAADRPTSVTIRLDRRISDKDTWEPYNTYTFTGESVVNGETWTYVIPRLLTTYKYRVVELNANNEEATAENNGNYIPSITPSGDTFTITNTLKWSAVKKSADDTNVGLSGAEFKLMDVNGTKLYATGESGDGGAIKWTPEKDVDLYALDNGEYRIYETKAPAGYMKNDSGWTVTFTNHLLTNLNSKSVTGTAATGVVIELTNQKLYTLPSTGGSGIYWYMIGGMVLMSTAAWILYKNKCREVLGK